jgi:hypothetical protein
MIDLILVILFVKVFYNMVNSMEESPFDGSK